MISQPRFFTKRVLLDSLFNRSTSGSSTHWVGSSFKSFAVLRSNNRNFSLSLVPDPKSGSLKGIPLSEGFYHNFQTMPYDAVFENTAEQSGVWVDILFSTEDELNSNPVFSRPEISTVEVGHGRGEIDGFTRQIQFTYEAASGNVRTFDLNDPQANTGTATINTLTLTNHYKIPQGFYGEIIGFSVNIRTALSAGFLHVHAIDDGATYLEASAPATNDIGYICNSTDIAGVFDVRVLNTGEAGDKGYERRGLFFYENEIPVLVNEDGLDASSDIIGYMLLRLRPVVEG